MASPMDWSPTEPRGIKRTSDGTMILASPYTPYPAGYIPGGWPASPSSRRRLFSCPEPDSEYLVVAQSKRICAGLKTCLTYTTTSMYNIARAVRDAQLQPARRAMRSIGTMSPTIPLRRMRPARAQSPVRPAPATTPPQSPQVTPSAASTHATMETSTPEPYPELGLPSKWPMLLSRPRMAAPPSPPPSSSPSPSPSPAAAQLLSELHEAALSDTESDTSSELDVAWLPTPIRKSTKATATVPTTPLPSIPVPVEKSSPAGLPSAQTDISSTFTITPTHAAWLREGRLDTPKSNTPKSAKYIDEKGKRQTRSLARKLLAERDAENYTLDRLSNEWEDKVQHALRNGHGNYTVHDLIKVVPPTNNPGRGTDSWLNDEVINGYLKIVCDHGNKDQKSGETPKFHAFISFFMNKVLDPKQGPTSVTRWAKKAKVGGKNLLKAEKLFFPINAGMHWTLLVVDVKQKTITHYNSLQGSGQRYIQAARNWMKLELGKDYVETDWTSIAVGESPQQDNMSDCGVFTITSAKQIMLGLDLTYGPADIPVQRRRIIAELVAGELIRKAS